jgi:TolA-binding protein
MAAGQLGGALFPTHELKDQQREAAARLDFGRAIEEWNQHEYPKAVAMFRKHVKDFPDSPWAAEAELHVGCDATYNGRYTEAQTIFQKLIAEH